MGLLVLSVLFSVRALLYGLSITMAAIAAGTYGAAILLWKLYSSRKVE
jgi:hypothetical protein